MHLLIIDDEEDLRRTLIRLLERLGCTADQAATLAEGTHAALSRFYHLILTDLKLPDGNGITLVEHLTRHRPETPIAVLTAYGDIETAVRAMKLGAIDFLTKPVTRERLQQLLAAAQALHPSVSSPVSFPPTSPLTRLIGCSPAIVHIREQIARYAKSLAPVLIQGPSGSGKELVARLLHETSPRASAPFIAVNCGALPPDLIEAELFGVKKGAYTGATADRPGLIAAAHRGTLFLDEIGELPLSLQPKLLRVLQERTYRPLGAPHEQSVDTRIIAATHVDLAAAVAAGRFRSDLYYRLAVLLIDIPPLAARPEDIPLLVHALIDQIARREQTPPPLILPEAITWLTAHSWPGNVRELENLLARLIASGVNPITPTALAAAFRPLPPAPSISVPPYSPSPSSLEPTPDQIHAALAAAGGNQSRAAQLLGLTLSQLRYRLRKWRLKP
ncbi:MAG: sigma-54 dependent transcriptional regulator [Hydrogenophilus sp.]|nr:sigma-54 dependent transcriptional regulator [Hydrogenophilus sp.]